MGLLHPAGTTKSFRYERRGAQGCGVLLGRLRPHAARADHYGGCAAVMGAGWWGEVMA